MQYQFCKFALHMYSWTQISMIIGTSIDKKGKWNKMWFLLYMILSFLNFIKTYLFKSELRVLNLF